MIDLRERDNTLGISGTEYRILSPSNKPIYLIPACRINNSGIEPDVFVKEFIPLPKPVTYFITRCGMVSSCL